MDDYDTHCFAPPPEVLKPHGRTVQAPDGELSLDAATTIARENIGAALNASAIEIISNPHRYTANERIAAFKELKELAYSRELRAPAVNIQINNAPLPDSDRAILDEYYRQRQLDGDA